MLFATSIAATLLASPAWGAAGADKTTPVLRAVGPAEAIAAAVNDLAETAHGITLDHPRHRAEFDADGVRFLPKRGGPAWRWSLASAAGSAACPTEPTIAPDRRSVRFDRGGIVEEYRLGTTGIEQVFVVPAALTAPGEELVVVGSIDCQGQFESSDQGWLWRTTDGVVSLGRVHVFDAAHRTIAASMRVEGDSATIAIEASALAGAAYPLTIDPEIGTNDFRLSTMGPDGDIDYDALRPAVAYNSLNNEYLVVWAGDDDANGVTDGEFEIFAQRINAATGAAVGSNDFRISDMGPDGDGQYDAAFPDVAYNATNNEYLVVWEGDDNSPGLIDGANEIFGQRLNAATGAEVGLNDFRISDMGVDSDALLDAERAAVAWNSVDNVYLVVWSGDDDTAPLVNGESEIFGQLLAGATGAEVGPNDFRISDMGPNGNGSYDAIVPDVAFNAANDEFLVVWQGDDNTAPLVDGENEIFGQRIAGRPAPSSAPTTCGSATWAPTAIRPSTPRIRRWRGAAPTTNTSWCGAATTTPAPSSMASRRSSANS